MERQPVRGVVTTVRGRAWIVVGVAVLGLGAGPRPPAPRLATSTHPELIAADRAWKAAEQVTDPAAAVQAWTSAATLYDAIVTSPTLTDEDRTEAAYAAMLAWDRAGATAQVIAAAGLVLHRGATGDDAANARWLRGRARWSRDDHDRAAADLVEILTHHRGHAVAPAAAQLLLDTFNRAGDRDAIAAWTAALLADPAFLAADPGVAELLHRIRAQATFGQAEALHGAGAYDRCGEAFLAAAADPYAGAAAHDARFNAATCFERAGASDRALAALRTITAASSPLAPRALVKIALARIALLEAARVNLEAAAAAADELFQRYPDDHDARELAERAILWRGALGQLDRAGRALDRLARLARKHPEDRGLRAIVVDQSTWLVDALLDAGKRRAAVARAHALRAEIAGSEPLLPWSLLAAGGALADASCPVELVAELCPRPRDKVLAVAARRALARATSRSSSGFGFDPDHHAARIALDLDLEPILARRSGPDRVAADAVRLAYRDLTTALYEPEVRVAAHARLGQLERHVREEAAAIAAFRSCVTTGRAELVAADFIALCERNLAALKFPDPERLPERVPAPSSASTPSIEGATLPLTRP